MFKLNKELLGKIIRYIRRYDFSFNNVTCGIIVSHPMAESSMRYIPNIRKSDNFEENVLNLTNESERDIFYNWVEKEFENAEFEDFFYCMIIKVYRLKILTFVLNELDVEINKMEMALLFTQSYESTELPYQDFDDIMELYYFLEGEDLQVLSTKVEINYDDNDMVEIYRGQLEGYDFNISWTTDYDIAKFFATRWGKNGVIYKAKVHKNDIWYTSNDRSEKEIILKPIILEDIVQYEIV
ncbi:MAG: hypothetical protein ACRC92_21810 [Peptostreptococcaceae bacterium]